MKASPLVILIAAVALAGFGWSISRVTRDHLEAARAETAKLAAQRVELVSLAFRAGAATAAREMFEQPGRHGSVLSVVLASEERMRRVYSNSWPSNLVLTGPIPKTDSQ